MVVHDTTRLYDSYDRPSFDFIVTEYRKAMKNLTIEPANRLKKEVKQLAEKQDEISLMKLKHEREMKQMREDVESKLGQIMAKIDVKKLDKNSSFVNIY